MKNLFAATLLIFFALPVFSSQEKLAELAARFSPVIFQELGTNPSADEFTRIDFDGDWNPENNWENQPRFERPPAVYWHVAESTKKYFITYAFFFPRDYARWCFWIHCHENDFEGARVTVDKAGMQAIKLEALAHNYQSEELNPPALELVIESGGHGIHPKSLRKPGDKFKKYLPGDYELISMQELWLRKDDKLFTGKFKYKGKSYPSNFGGSTWILFGLGAAKPPWSWEVWNSDLEKGQWFLDPEKRKKKKKK